MNTKQEKLAAARRKLKEFQGKQKENDVNRTKNTMSPASMSRKLSSSSTSTDTTSSCRMEHNNIDHRSPELCYPSTSENHGFKMEEKLSNNPAREIDSRNPVFSSYPTMSFNQSINRYSELNLGHADSSTSGEFFNKEIADCYITNPNVANVVPSNHANGLFTSEIDVPCNKVEQHSVPDNSESNNMKAEICTLFKNSDGYSAPETGSNFPVMPQGYAINNDPKEFFSGNFINSPSEMYGKPTVANWNVQPTQSVSQLVEEKNSLMQVLKRTEELLKLKTDQEESMTKNFLFLQSKIAELEERLLTAQREAQDLRVANEKLLKQRDIDFKTLEDLQRNFTSREEQFSELQRKLEIKMRECENSNLKLKESDAQLSSSLIKIQQLSLGESNEVNVKIGDLQSENSRLMGRIQDLEKRLEILDREKEQSSQSFHMYAQLYDGQINTLSTEVRNLVKENQQLLEKNDALEKNINELRKQKDESNSVVDEARIADLTNKLTQLTEENGLLHKDLTEKIDEIQALEKDKMEKSEDLIRISAAMQRMRSEYMKQQEDSASHQKLLAAVESDKIAASRAVAQNYKLKEQMAELEEGFIKLSHEKLQLTDELSHEKHVRKELELRLQTLESGHCHEHDDGHDHDHDHHNHSKSSDGTTNESADIEELKNIIRQLEEDKTELLSRLNSTNSTKESSYLVDKITPETHNEDPESSKLLLQQMEEKVKKTMNDIAALDEEKEKLEHLVLQLQGETETIGEYISLYQTQRMMLRQRNKEKDDQLMQLCKDKEELKSKLSTLNDLVNHLITTKGINAAEVTDIDSLVIEDNKEVNEETAMKIQTLINEIQSTNLIDNQSVAFEHCPCCSGRLITV